MNRILGVVYEAAGLAAGGATSIAARLGGEGKVSRSLRARRGVLARYVAWAAAHRDRTRPLLWMHAPSVGEGLQARPVLEELRRRRPSLQVVYTYFSPSAEGFAPSLASDGLADFTDVLPWDTGGDARQALDALTPSALLFSKLDVWPTLVRVAAQRRIPLGLISATLAAASTRNSRWGRALLGDAYAHLDAVGAISAADGERLRALGASPSAIRVTGDTRYDQVWARAQRVDRAVPPIAALASGARPTVVAGSTWPADERVLLPAWEALRGRVPSARLILAPHEPTPDHLAAVERWASSAGCRLSRLDAAEATSAEIVLVDRVGVLATLYAVADVAFVGGGFHAAGLHSVIEPAAFGVPVLFGPRHAASADAALLLTAGAAREVRTPDDIAETAARWLTDSTPRRDAGDRARAVVQAGLGATARSVEMIEVVLLDGGG